MKPYISHIHSCQDLDVAFEDQQRINLFARKNARLTDLKELIQAKEVGDHTRTGAFADFKL